MDEECIAPIFLVFVRRSNAPAMADLPGYKKQLDLGKAHLQ